LIKAIYFADPATSLKKATREAASKYKSLGMAPPSAVSRIPIPPPVDVLSLCRPPAPRGMVALSRLCRSIELGISPCAPGEVDECMESIESTKQLVSFLLPRYPSKSGLIHKHIVEQQRGVCAEISRYVSRYVCVLVRT
jgi:hypothetical protein